MKKQIIAIIVGLLIIGFHYSPLEDMFIKYFENGTVVTPTVIGCLNGMVLDASNTCVIPADGQWFDANATSSYEDCGECKG